MSFGDIFKDVPFGPIHQYGDPSKLPLDQEDLIDRIREMESLASKIEPQLDLPEKDPQFSSWITRYALIGIEVKRLLIHAEEILNDTELAKLKVRLNTEIQPMALNRYEKYRFTDYGTEAGI